MDLSFTKLKLTNIKSYRTGDHPIKIDFGLGKNIIIGENGSGKSSILEALYFALYNKYLKGTQEDLVTYDKQIGKIELELLTSNNDHLTIIRNVNSPKEQDLCRVNGFDKFVGDKEITPRIEELLGFDANTFKNIIHAEQGQIAQILSTEREKRKEVFDKLLDVHKYQKTQKDLNKIQNSYKDEINQKEERSKIKKENIEELKPKRKKYNESNNERNDNLKRLDIVSKKRKELDDELSILRPMNETHQKLNSSITHLRNDIYTLEQEYYKAENQLRTPRIKEKIFISQSESIEGEVKQLGHVKDNLIEENETLSDEISDLTHKKDLMEGFESSLELQKDDLETTSTNKDITIQKIQKIVNTDKDIEKCQADDFPLKQLYKNKLSHNFQMKSTWILFAILVILGIGSIFIPSIGLQVIFPIIVGVSLLILLGVPFIQCYRSKQRLPGLFLKFEDLIEKYQNIEQKIKKIQEEILPIKDIDFTIIYTHAEQRKKNKLKIQVIEDDLKILVAIEKYSEQWISKINDVKVNEEVLQELLTKFDPEDFKQKLDELNKKEKRIIQLNSEIKGLVELIEELSKDVELLERLEKEYEEEQVELQALTKEHSTCLSLKEIIAEFIPTIRRIRLNKLNIKANELLSDLGKELSLEEVFVDESYDITVKRSNKKRRVNDLSGGEGIIIALTLRLAIVDVMSHLKILFLDEPTIHLDPKSIEVLISCLEKVSGFTQMIIITHNQNFQRLADRFFKVSKSESQISQVTMVE